MAAYDDRPISVYDNLNMPAPLQATGIHHANSTKAAKSLTPTTTTATKAAQSTSTAPTTSALADLTFHFNGNNNNNKPYQQQHPNEPVQNSLPNGNTNYNQFNNNNNNKQVLGPPPEQPPHTVNTIAAPTPLYTQPATVEPHTSNGPAAAHRPLSQHSQTELNETSQNIAAVKAALNDAKSKFFGLNGYAQNPHDIAQQLLDNDNHTDHRGQHIQIVGGPTKSQPKYQNIPENSAIFRQQHSPTPPQLPPKPERLRQSPTKEMTMHPTASGSQPQSQPQQQEVPQTSSKILHYSTMYQQVPLNDSIDTVQPSQAVYMSTTVPQNIKGSKIAGRHTPTRNSLRHSRMLVINNKNYQVVQHPNPMNFKQPNLARWLLIFQILIGLLISFLVVWTFVLSSNTPIQDNPFWSSLMLIAAGIVGLLLVRYHRVKRHKVRENCFIFMRANSCVLSLLAVLLCCVACILASIHYARLTAADTQCVPSNVLLEHGACLCSFNVPPTAGNQTFDGALTTAKEEQLADTTTTITTAIPPKPDRSYQVEYRDFSCTEVLGVWVHILSYSIALNALGFLVSLLYIVLLVCYRYNAKRFYSSVHVSSF